jgi:hypothetical protein
MSHFALLPLLSFLIAAALSAQAQAQGMTVAPLGSYVDVMNTLKVLDDAAATRDRAEAFDRTGNFFQEIEEYDGLIGRWQNAPTKAEAVWKALAGANVQAARARALYAATAPDFQKNLSLREQNLSLINQHIAAASQDAANAETAIRVSTTMFPDTKRALACVVYKIRGTVASLQGIVDRSPGLVDTGIRWFQATLDCDPQAAPQMRNAISRLSGFRREIANSFLSDDNIAQTVSTFFKEVVPHGNLISYLIAEGYRFYKQRQPSPLQALPH